MGLFRSPTRAGGVRPGPPTRAALDIGCGTGPTPRTSRGRAGTSVGRGLRPRGDRIRRGAGRAPDGVRGHLRTGRRPASRVPSASRARSISSWTSAATTRSPTACVTRTRPRWLRPRAAGRGLLPRRHRGPAGVLAPTRRPRGRCRRTAPADSADISTSRRKPPDRSGGWVASTEFHLFRMVRRSTPRDDGSVRSSPGRAVFGRDIAARAVRSWPTDAASCAKKAGIGEDACFAGLVTALSSCGERRHVVDVARARGARFRARMVDRPLTNRANGTRSAPDSASPRRGTTRSSRRSPIPMMPPRTTRSSSTAHGAGAPNEYAPRSSPKPPVNVDRTEPGRRAGTGAPLARSRPRRESSSTTTARSPRSSRIPTRQPRLPARSPCSNA